MLLPLQLNNLLSTGGAAQASSAMPIRLGLMHQMRMTPGLIVMPPVTPFNNPPQWDSQPNGNFVFGTASQIDLDDISSDLDLDAITITKNATALPTGFTYTQATAILAYDGIGAVVSSPNHVWTLDDGTDTTDSNSITISVVDTTWPVNGWFSQGGYMISSQDDNLGSLRQPINGQKDLIIYQWRNQSVSRMATERTNLLWYDANAPDTKMVQYVIPGETVKVADSSASNLTKSLIEDATDGSTSWYLKNSSGAQVEAKFDAVNFWKCNEADAQAGTNSLSETFATAFYKMWFNFHNDATSPRINLIDGVFHDVIPPVPQTVRINNDTSSSDFDYEDDGSSTNRTSDTASGGGTLFRTGINAWRTAFTTRYGSSYAYGGNNTRFGIDYEVGDATKLPINTSEAYQVNDFGLYEGAEKDLNLEDTATGYTSDGGGNPVPLKFFRRLALIATNVVPTASNKWSKGVVLVELDLNNRTPQAIDYEAHRTHAVCCVLAGQMCGTTRTKRVPAEPLDEMVKDWGNPIGGDPFMVTLDLTDATAVLRAADFTSGGATFHWKEFDNGIVVLRSDWFPQGAGDNFGTGSAVNCELPDPGVGMKWIHPNLTAYTHPTSGRTTLNQSPTINDGSDVASGGSFGVVALFEAHARFLERVAV